MDQVAAEIEGTGFIKDTHSLKNIRETQTAINTALTFQHQPQKQRTINNPVQNEWYTLLDSATDGNNLRLYAVGILIQTGQANEEVEARLTIDGQTLTRGAVTTLTAGTMYYAYVNYGYSVQFVLGTSYRLIGQATPLEARNVKIEVRKTSANGNGYIGTQVDWAKR